MSSSSHPTPSAPALSASFVEWNNQGAVLIRQRQYLQAISCFSKSLTVIKTQLAEAPSSTSSPSHGVGSISHVAHLIRVEPPNALPAAAAAAADADASDAMDVDDATSACGIDQGDHEDHKEHKEHDDVDAKYGEKTKRDRPSSSSSTTTSATSDVSEKDGGAFLYRQPIRIDDALAELTLPHSVLRSLSVLVIINTALAHHLLAASYRTTGNQLGTPSMKRAIALYETALQTQAQQMTMQPLGVDGFQLLLACYNNLGHAQRSMGQAKRSKLCFQSLLSLLMWSVVHRALAADCVDPYWSSVEHLLSSGPLPAAAA